MALTEESIIEAPGMLSRWVRLHTDGAKAHCIDEVSVDPLPDAHGLRSRLARRGRSRLIDGGSGVSRSGSPAPPRTAVLPRRRWLWQGNGTSCSAPFVAGTAALVRAYRPTLSAAQVKRRLLATATHPAAQLPDPALGWGTVNPLSAVTAVLPEEGGSGRPAAVVPPDARGPGVTPRDELGPVPAVAG